MTPARWVRVKEVLRSVLDRPGEERAEFLDQACGTDEGLRREVESLLAREHDSRLASPLMALKMPEVNTGQMLGRYRVELKLGQGGMGAVYRAHDTVLRRPVALKVLPPGQMADPESQDRLTREARAASALNHPRIVTVYDIAQAEGIAFVAMEYVAGRTLEKAIPPKGLPIDEALKYAVQAADALAAAHAAGIVHRDIKPSNIVVSDQGQVKVLDFGLAKLANPVATAPEDWTLTPATAEGVIMGTAAYMSPEQAQGKPVDARSDIFSFGATLYEMVTGRRAFPGDTPISTIAAILTQEPVALEAGVPPDLAKVIGRCLRKDRSRRFQNMADVKVALEEVREESTPGRPAAPAPARHSKWLWAGVACVCAAVLVALGLTVSVKDTPRPALTAVPLTSYPGDETSPSLSPDGSQVAFAWNGDKQDNFDIYAQVIGSGKPLRLTTNPAPDFYPVWSPDGRYIAFLRYQSGNSSIVLISPLGGTERIVGEASSYGLAWAPDSRWIAYTEAIAPGNNAGIFLLSIETGERRRLTTAPKPFWDCWPAFSPDGRALALMRYGKALSAVYLVPLSDAFQPKGEPRQLSTQDTISITPAWSADGREIIFSAGHQLAHRLLSIRADRALSGRSPGPAKAEVLPVTGDIVDYPAVSGARRRLVYRKSNLDLDVWRIDLDERVPNPVARSFITSTRQELGPQFSPDGKRIAFASDRSGSYEVWVSNLDGSSLEKLTSMNAPITCAQNWSPDGKSIVFASNAGGQFDLYTVAANGGNLRRLTDLPSDDEVPSWSHDGGWIYFASDRSGRPQLWKMPAKGGDAVQITKEGGFEPLESPDGKTLYYLKDGMPLSLWKAPVGGGEEIKILDNLRESSWAVTGKGIYFERSLGANGRSSIQFMDFKTGTSRVIKVIEKPLSYGLTVSPDDRTLLYTPVENRGSDLMLVENFQ